MTEWKLMEAAAVPTPDKATAYTVPDGKALTLKVISMVNSETVDPRTVNVYIKKAGGSSMRIWPRDLELLAKASHRDAVSWCLSAGDIIEWHASGTGVEGVISGIIATQ